MKKILLVLVCLLIIPSNSMAKDEVSKVFMHQGPDGTISFFAQDATNPFSTSINVVLELHKVIAPDKSYYALRTCVSKYKAYETPIAKVILNLDGNDYLLTSLPGARYDELLGAVQEWFEVPDDLLTKLLNAKKISTKITYTNGKSRQDEQRKRFISSVQRLQTITKENYQQQDNIVNEKSNCVLYIPGVKPSELIPAIIYNVNYDPFSKKDQLSSYYYQVSISPDYKYLALYNVISRSEGISFCGWLSFYPQDSGTWVTVDLLDGGEYGAWRKMETKGDSGIMNLYRANDIINSLVYAYKIFYGTYDLGFTWDPIISEKNSKNTTRAEWRPGPFVINNVNVKLNPELEQIKKGDIITEINGTSTTNMNYMDTLIKVLYSGKKATVTIKDPLGNLKTLSIQPKFTSAETNTKKFMDIIAKDTRQLSEFDRNRDYPFAFPMSYNPLGKGLQ